MTVTVKSVEPDRIPVYKTKTADRLSEKLLIDVTLKITSPESKYKTKFGVRLILLSQDGRDMGHQTRFFSVDAKTRTFEFRESLSVNSPNCDFVKVRLLKLFPENFLGDFSIRTEQTPRTRS